MVYYSDNIWEWWRWANSASPSSSAAAPESTKFFADVGEEYHGPLDRQRAVRGHPRSYYKGRPLAGGRRPAAGAHGGPAGGFGAGSGQRCLPTGGGPPAPSSAAEASGPLALAASADIFFPVLHGPYGEDGTIQGLFDLAGVPYVGAGVAASAVGMDKAFMKMAFQHAGLPVLDYVVFTEVQWAADAVGCISLGRELGYPLLVKPANFGVLGGASAASLARDQLDGAVEEALRHDRKVIVERAAEDCREVEVSVLGNDDPQASIPGEIVPSNDFYDYEAKYLSDESELIIPARISEAAAEQVRQMAVAVFQAVDASGLARVDFFVHKETEAVWVNEINTMPGFTRISMYPKLWEATGLPYPELIHRLIQLGLERHERRRRREAAAGDHVSGR